MQYKCQFPAYAATRPSLEVQLLKVQGEAQEAVDAEDWWKQAVELFDTIHAAETALLIIARGLEHEYRLEGIKGDTPKRLAVAAVFEDAYNATIEKNERRGYYERGKECQKN